MESKFLQWEVQFIVSKGLMFSSLIFKPGFKKKINKSVLFLGKVQSTIAILFNLLFFKLHFEL